MHFRNGKTETQRLTQLPRGRSFQGAESVVPGLETTVDTLKPALWPLPAAAVINHGQFSSLPTQTCDGSYRSERSAGLCPSADSRAESVSCLFPSKSPSLGSWALPRSIWPAVLPTAPLPYIVTPPPGLASAGSCTSEDPRVPPRPPR